MSDKDILETNENNNLKKIYMDTTLKFNDIILDACREKELYDIEIERVLFDLCKFDNASESCLDMVIFCKEDIIHSIAIIDDLENLKIYPYICSEKTGDVITLSFDYNLININEFAFRFASTSFANDLNIKSFKGRVNRNKARSNMEKAFKRIKRRGR